MTTPRYRLIEQRREQLGISAEEMARRIDVPLEMYWEVEGHDDELTMVLPLQKVRTLAAVLGFEIGPLLGAGLPVEAQNAGRQPRHILLAEARQRLGVSRSKMAVDIGFEEVFVHIIESNCHVLEAWPYDVLKIVANYLKLDPIDLLYTQSASNAS